MNTTAEKVHVHIIYVEIRIISKMRGFSMKKTHKKNRKAYQVMKQIFRERNERRTYLELEGYEKDDDDDDDKEEEGVGKQTFLTTSECDLLPIKRFCFSA